MPKKRTKKAPREKIDGLSPTDRKKLHAACRKVWGWSYPKKLCIARATGKDGFARCENPECSKKGKRVPKVYADHIEPVGEVGAPGYLERLFCPSKDLQALCRPCHDKKTRAERKAAQAAQELAELGL